MHVLEGLSDCTTFVIAQFTTFCLRIMTFQLPLFWITLYVPISKRGPTFLCIPTLAILGVPRPCGQRIPTLAILGVPRPCGQSIPTLAILGVPRPCGQSIPTLAILGVPPSLWSKHTYTGHIRSTPILVVKAYLHWPY